MYISIQIADKKSLAIVKSCCIVTTSLLVLSAGGNSTNHIYAQHTYMFVIFSTVIVIQTLTQFQEKFTVNLISDIETFTTKNDQNNSKISTQVIPVHFVETLSYTRPAYLVLKCITNQNLSRYELLGLGSRKNNNAYQDYHHCNVHTVRELLDSRHTVQLLNFVELYLAMYSN